MTPEQYIEMQSEIQRRHVERVTEALQSLAPALQPQKETDEERRSRWRDCFAMASLQGMRASGDDRDAAHLAWEAYMDADAMLAERDKKSG